MDVVKGERIADDEEFTLVVLLGSDYYNGIRSILKEAIAKFDEWKDIASALVETICI